MAMNTHTHMHRGFALLIAVIFTSVVLAFALSFGALGYKQSVLYSASKSSQAAFYAADAALECLLLADKSGQDKFNPSGGTGVLPCDGSSVTLTKTTGTFNSIAYTIFTGQLTLTNTIGSPTITQCADVQVYKPTTDFTQRTYLFAQGYNTDCTTVNSSGRFSVRGIQASY